MCKIFRAILRCFFSIFYERKYLRGYYFDTKRIGWYWSLRGIKSRIIGPNGTIPWPVNPNTIISNPRNIDFDINDLHIFQTPGCYWQNHDGIIKVGRRCSVAPNVGIITTNHDTSDLSKHVKGKDIVIGDDCWIGMNSMILPGVVLGDHTVVGAGSVVTHSFPEGHCVIVGNPARLLKQL